MTDIIQYEGIENLGTTTDLINGKPIYDLDRIIETSGFTTAGDGGAGKWKQNGITGQTPSQTPAQLGNALLNDASGNQWSLVVEGDYNPHCLGSVSDGVTDNTLTIQSTINAAKNGNLNIRWGGGTYYHNNNLSDLHSVRHEGSGAIKNGSSVFYVNPKKGQNNKFYIDVNGSDSNSGTSPSFAFKTLQGAFDAAINYGPKLYGFWSFVLSAGVYTDTASWPDALSSDEVIQVRGPDVSNSTPTAIIDGQASPDDTGILFGRIGLFELKDVKCINWSNGSTKSGITAPGICRLVTPNYHASNCDIGAEIRYNSEFQSGPYGVYDGNMFGIRFFHCSTGFIGRKATSRSEGVTFKNNTVAGVRLQEECTSHVDYCTFEDNNRGVDVTEQSRSSINYNDFKRNNTAILSRGNSTIFNNLNLFNEGTPDANTLEVDKRSSSYDQYSIEYESQLSAKTDLEIGSFSGLSEVDIYSYNLKEYVNIKPGKNIEFFVSGFFGGGGTKTIKLYLEGNVVGSLTSQDGSSSLFRCVFNIFPKNKTDQVGSGELIQNNQEAKTFSTSSIGADMSTQGDKELKLTFKGSESGSTANIKVVEIKTCG